MEGIMDDVQYSIMRRSARIVVFFSYYYAQLMGFVRFGYDFRNEELCVKPWITVYSLLANAAILGITALTFRSRLSEVMLVKSARFDYLIVILMSLLRVAIAILIMVLSWADRKQIMSLIQDFQLLSAQFLRKTPFRAAILTSYENKIVYKFIFCMISVVGVWAQMLLATLDTLDMELFVIITIVALLINLLNMLMNQYFFAVHSTNLFFKVLYEELKQVMLATKHAERKRRQRPNNRTAAFVVECSLISDKLDQLVVVHRRLVQLIHKINSSYGVPGVGMVTSMYLCNIGMIYVGYKFVQLDTDFVGNNLLTVFVNIVSVIAFYMDELLFLGALVDDIALFDACAELLRQQLPLPRLDDRLEQSFETLRLQIIREPITFSVIGLFNFTIAWGFATFTSALSTSIILMQQDYIFSN